MRRIIVFLLIIMTIFLLAGCQKENNNSNNENIVDNNKEVPENENENNSKNEDINNQNNENEGNTNNTQNDKNVDNNENEDVSPYTIEDYFPFVENRVLVYEGEGNEYASFTVWTDYYDKEKGRIQKREDNSGTVMAKVYEINNNEVYIVYTRPEFYYRDNLLDKEHESKKDILLKEPFEVGNKWEVPNKGVREITSLDVEITTEVGTYKTIEVTTEYNESGSLSKRYYAKDIGLIKEVYNGEDYQVSSTLAEIRESTPYKKNIQIYYPDESGDVYSVNYSLKFDTNIDSKKVIEEAFKHETEGHPALISDNTTINSLYIDDDNIVHIDLSKDFIEDMNYGAMFEELNLRCLANTLGRYYGTEKIKLTIDGENYEGGHILIEEGEFLIVDYPEE